MNERGRATRLTAVGLVAATMWGGGAAVARPAPPAPAVARSDAGMRWRVDHGAVHAERDALPRALDTLRHSRPGTAAAAARAVVRAGARQAGFTGPLDDVSGSWTDLVAVGDLDGDGRADTVEMADVHNAAGHATILRARRGSDGRVLWEQRITGYAAVRGARVGASGGQGLLVLSMVQQVAQAPVAFAVAEAWTLSAYDGRGTQLWARPLAPDVWGFTLVGGALVNTPAMYGIGDLLPGKADDIVFGAETLAFTLAGWAEESPVFVINGADGTIGPAAAPTFYKSAAPGSFVFVVPDLSGDGLDDLVVETGYGNKVALVAQPATGGAPVWTATDLPLQWVTWVDPVGDVTADRRGDLAVTTDPSNGTDPDAVKVLVLNGADGKVATSHPGEFAMGVGDVDHDGRRDVAVMSFTIDSPRFALLVTTYGASGRVLYRHVESAGPIGDDENAFIGIRDVGDVQGDGVDDLATALDYRSRTREALLDGRTGRVLHRKLAHPIHGTFDGRGDDFLEVTKPNGGTVRFTALQGSTGRVLWSTDVKSGAGGSVFDSVITWADVDGDRCVDLVVSLHDDHGTVAAVLRGRDGRPAWGVRTTAAGAGRLTGVTPGKDANPGC